jgi:hypothetical protein
MLLAGNISLESFLATLIVMLFGMGWHEYGHALMADWWGDPTPRSMGRLTPNPFVHINWIGWLFAVFVGFGVLGSVPVNPRLMRDPRWGSFWTSFAGPLANLLQAFVYALGWFLVFHVLGMRNNNFLSSFLLTLMHLGIFLNIAGFFFNLLPMVLPGAIFGYGAYLPMDGWNILYSLLPGNFLNRKSVPKFIWDYLPGLGRFLIQPAYTWYEWMPIAAMVTLVILLLGFALPNFSPIWWLIGNPVYGLTNLLKGF